MIDYEKAYKEALDRAKNGKWDEYTPISRVLKEVFPVLAESEDEKIRKEIIESIEDNMSVIHKDKCIAWLEKHKSVVVPKFRVGDTIRIKNSNAEYLITDISDGNYRGKGWSLDIVTCDESDDYELVEEKSAEWNKEDEEMREDAIEAVKHLISTNESWSYLEDSLDWLKSLKPQNRWKPSELDINLFERIANGKSNPQDFQASLGGLIGQLKKLKGE